jgi:hypothetical protein
MTIKELAKKGIAILIAVVLLNVLLIVLSVVLKPQMNTLVEAQLSTSSNSSLVAMQWFNYIIPFISIVGYSGCLIATIKTIAKYLEEIG